MDPVTMASLGSQLMGGSGGGASIPSPLGGGATSSAESQAGSIEVGGLTFATSSKTTDYVLIGLAVVALVVSLAAFKKGRK